MRIATVIHRTGLRTIQAGLLALAVGGAMAQAPDQDAAPAAPPPPRPLLLLLQPAPFNHPDKAGAGIGVVDVTLKVPDVQVGADTALLQLPLAVEQGETVAVTLKELTVRDSHGNVPLATRDVRGPDGKLREWTSPREVQGDLVVHYQAPVEPPPPKRRAAAPPDATPGPMLPPPATSALRVERGGLAVAGNALVLLPPDGRQYPVSVRWDLSKLGDDASASSSAGDGDVLLPTGAPSRLWSTTFTIALPKRASN